MSTARNLNHATALRAPVERRASVKTLRAHLLGSPSHGAVMRSLQASEHLKRLADAAKQAKK